MIGVLSKPHQSEAAREFFQMFKTPWEFYEEHRSYDVVIATETEFTVAQARLILICGADPKRFDAEEGIEIRPLGEGAFLQTDRAAFPVYKSVSSIDGPGKPSIRVKDGPGTAGMEFEKAGRRILRLGYDPFEEVSFLLSTGQPRENAPIPTLELHIAMLRTQMLDCGIPFVEIPPVPAGYNFSVCLTHDIDFIRIRDHKFDHTMFGFLYRATVGTLVDVLSGKRPWKMLLQNWIAALSLPLVHLGICRDFWFSFDRYLEIEKGMKSTFFLIPFKNRAGSKVPGRHAERRAAKYDIQDVRDKARELVSRGAEIGVHGIDAWHDPGSARQEYSRIRDVTGQAAIGIRSHWLCFDEATPRILEEAGFSYDSTYGYNDAAGFRAGSLQAFKPLSAKTLLELPLHIQDTALFNPKHMDLSEPQAWRLCRDLVEKAGASGGVLTTLWHDRSLAPERLYGDFYAGLLEELRAQNAWFATGGEITNWFRQRRKIAFEKVQFEGGTVRIRLSHDDSEMNPRPLLRIYNPCVREGGTSAGESGKRYSDIPWTGEADLRIHLEPGAPRQH